MKEIEHNCILEIPGRWNIPYLYSAGRTATRFFIDIRDHKRLSATRCSHCERVYLPPRSFCEKCFRKLDEWVEVGLEGSVETFTIVSEPFEGFPKPPYALAYVLLDGANTAVANYVTGLDLSKSGKPLKLLKVGSRVKVVFKSRRKGRITDFVFKLDKS